MSRPGIEIVDLRGQFEPGAEGRAVPLTITAGVLRISAGGFTALFAPLEGRVERIAHGRITLRLPAPVPLLGRVMLSLDFKPAIGARGRVNFELVNFHAGLIPVPPFVVSGVIGGKVRGVPGIHVAEDYQIQVDLAELLGLAGIALPAPSALGADGGILEVAY